MAVKETSAQILPARSAYTDPIRPDVDWVDIMDTNRYDRNTWFYPWQGFGLYCVATINKGPGYDLRRINTRRTLQGVPKVIVCPRRRGMTFTDLLYGKLQLNPSLLNMGNVLNNQTRQVELWNSSFVPVTVAQITRSNDDGVDLDAPATPFVLQPMQALTIDVGVATTGPTNIDARFVFDAVSVKDVSLQVVGTRSVVFSLMPDTSKNYTEKMSWVSDIITSKDGTEQRMALNEWPDTQISMTVHQHSDKLHNLSSLLWGWQHRIYQLPLWHRHANLTETAYQELNTVMCETAYAGFRVGGMAVIWGGFDYFETVEVEEIQADRIITKRPLIQGWGRGTLVAACRAARLPQETGSTWANPDLAEVQLDFVFTDVEVETPFEFPTTYRDSPVLLIPPNWVSPLDERNIRNMEIFETALKSRFTVLNNDVPNIVRTHAWFLNSKLRIHQFRRWLYARRGRVVPYWSPSWKNDFTLASKVEVGAISIEVRNVGYRNFYQTRYGRQDLIMFLRDGTKLMRRITSAAQGETTATEILLLDQEISRVIEPKDVEMVSFLGQHRLDADDIELDWRSDKLVLANQNMRLLTDGV
jgi:hypothetical protein